MFFYISNFANHLGVAEVFRMMGMKEACKESYLFRNSFGPPVYSIVSEIIGDARSNKELDVRVRLPPFQDVTL